MRFWVQTLWQSNINERQAFISSNSWISTHGFLIAFFSATLRTERQWCDLATSLSLLSMCERGFKRLQECWECYSDKLTEPGVYQPLFSITVKLRRGAKAQFKVG